LLAGLAWVLLTHWPFLRLPYHWDELGYFIPAAHDLLTEGTPIPRSTPPNVHPPLVMAYLAAVWKVFGFAAPVTRVAMLVWAAGVLTAAFLLGRRLAGERAGWIGAGLLAVSPPFVAQSMLAHLDLPATLWVLLALLFFLEDRWTLCAAAATALVLTKETGILVPLVLAASDRRRRRLAIPPVLALAAWLLFLRASTGHWLGNAEFERYNVSQALDWGRIPLVLLRRLYQLGFANFHWVGVVVLWRARRLGREERVAGVVLLAYLLLHSVVGGAILLRYLLPAIALFYILAAPRIRGWALGVLAAGLAASNWWNPPYPFGYEDNLAVVDFVQLQQQAAAWLAERRPEHRVITAWPMTDALANPIGGYVSRPFPVRAVEDFQQRSWEGVRVEARDLVVLYARSWQPRLGWQRWPPLAALLQRYFDYAPQIRREELMRQFGLRSLTRWERGGQWMEVFERAPERASSVQ
jgi:4-amino-4-deoxy-L-arabinose transferase-like glycosyltransferase